VPSGQFFTQDGCVLFYRSTYREFILRAAIGIDLVSNAVIQSQNAFVVQISNSHELSPIRDYLLLDFSPISTRRRMASERVVSFAAAQASTLAIDPAGILATIWGSLPVGGRPLFLGITFIDFFII
jgi:hypothetical protein